ncbi:hypothetical protein Pcinc_024003 [Petrolisthes cinctipes]|uniref:HTH CENPB-type domain-containing protein n=1 Tax=Petrolisthes cinctipes TaxID=88211 RepID=A0AAE1FAR1_PETCI|nr:hypothetical protein Pcinc_024003 [Petrolisthes cinctipes]
MQLEKGLSIISLTAEYNVGVTTVKDLSQIQDKIKAFSPKFDISEKGEEAKTIRKILKLLKDSELEESVYKWGSQQQSNGIPVHGCDIQHAAQRLAQHLSVENFKSSSGWLWRFRQRHGKSNKPVCGESLSADVEAVEPFCEKINELIKSEKN